MTNDRLAAALADRYRIERELGQGGMATVYLAADLKHDRKVAIKVLKPELAAVLGAERFVVEIKTTAALSHPHILPLFDSGEAAGFLFYVMPYIEGETIREKLNRETQFGIEEALKITTEVADALDYAHRHGVIHRDIKPENILLHDGRPMVMDFGIALAVSAAAGGRMTETGLSLGTPHYMSPEQATAEKEITPRSDIYSLASVLYEMLAGEPPHTAGSAQAVIMKVITTAAAPVNQLRKNVPANVVAALAKALEKLPADRFESARHFADALLLPSFTALTTGAASLGAAAARRRARLPWAIAAVAVVVAGVSLARPDQPTTAGAPMFVELDIATLGMRGASNANFAVSPDGRMVALVVRSDSVDGLAIRSLDSLGVRHLARTRGASNPFWSPDGRSIGFFAYDSLRTVEVATGSVRVWCAVEFPRGGTWAKDGTILAGANRGLAKLSLADGACTPRIPDGLEGGRIVRPYFFPDGEHFVASTARGVWLGRLGEDSLTRLRDLSNGEAVLAPPDFLVAPGPAGLQIQRIDLKARRLVGDPVGFLPSVPTPGGHTAIAFSANGVLVTSFAVEGGGAAGSELGLVSRGSAALRLLQSASGVWEGPRLSRDGTGLVMGGWNVQSLDLRSMRWERLAGTSDRGRDLYSAAMWAPGDSALVFVASTVGASVAPATVRTLSVATGATRTTRRMPFPHGPGPPYSLQEVSPDGSRLVYTSRGEPWEYHIVADSASRMFAAPDPVDGVRSHPNGRVVAYERTVEGERQVFVRQRDGPAAGIRVAPGRWPRWSRRGDELFFVDPDDNVIAVPIRTADPLSVGAPAIVAASAVFTPRRITWFEAAPDGRQFYVKLATDVRALNVVLYWQGLVR
ncbi:MAG: protein kinase [Gemmatimonadetes bacterium]|nr:protein kinase [Gemmatimonadota bacterium]